MISESYRYPSTAIEWIMRIKPPTSPNPNDSPSGPDTPEDPPHRFWLCARDGGGKGGVLESWGSLKLGVSKAGPESLTSLLKAPPVTVLIVGAGPKQALSQLGEPAMFPLITQGLVQKRPTVQL